MHLTHKEVPGFLDFFIILHPDKSRIFIAPVVPENAAKVVALNSPSARVHQNCLEKNLVAGQREIKHADKSVIVPGILDDRLGGFSREIPPVGTSVKCEIVRQIPFLRQ